MIKLVLVRHGQSEWNLENKFTGWIDVDLSPNGVNEAKTAGLALKEAGFTFDVAYSSVLKRANRTLDLILEQLGQSDLPKNYTWRLNERHYGALQGLNKAESALKWGDEQIHIWRRSADIQPPALTKDDPRFPGNQEKYQELVKKGEMKEEEWPLTECLIDTANRFRPYFEKIVAQPSKKASASSSPLTAIAFVPSLWN